ncbi:hypothetical protein GCM10010302_63650 [Streptomyces polychromogenes]|uniref:Uncharacterized protein n=1 Tax=Streptomyces polychromogenes TaxID=67342 RepID=A0ABP3FID7_9ACTN
MCTLSCAAREAMVARFLAEYPGAGRPGGGEHPALRGCEEVPWAELTGCTAQIPALLHGLLDPAAGHEAQRVLTNTLMSHMLLLGPATPAALPFLLRLAVEPELPARGPLLGFLGFAAELSRPARPGEEDFWFSGDEQPEGERCRAAFAANAHLVRELVDDAGLPDEVLDSELRADLRLLAGLPDPAAASPTTA